jgi:hypothetical protein
MRLVVADTSPSELPCLIGQSKFYLPSLKIFVLPQIVQNNCDTTRLRGVRRWIAEPPSWLEIVPEELQSDEPTYWTWTTADELRSCL